MVEIGHRIYADPDGISRTTVCTALGKLCRPVSKTPEEIMKTCLLLALVGLNISFVLPTLAQEQSAVDPKTRQEIEAAATQLVEAYNKQDAAAMAALYTQDAVLADDWNLGSRVGREAIEKYVAEEFATSFPPVVSKPVQMYAFEDSIVTISEFSGGRWHGHTVKIYVRDPDTWKIRMEFITASKISR